MFKLAVLILPPFNDIPSVSLLISSFLRALSLFNFVELLLFSAITLSNIDLTAAASSLAWFAVTCAALILVIRLFAFSIIDSQSKIFCWAITTFFWAVSLSI